MVLENSDSGHIFRKRRSDAGGGGKFRAGRAERSSSARSKEAPLKSLI